MRAQCNFGKKNNNPSLLPLFSFVAMYESRLRKRKAKEEEPQEKEVVEVSKKKLKTSTTKRSNKKKVVEEVVLDVEPTVSEPDLDLTKTCPNEVCTDFFLLFILYFIFIFRIIINFTKKNNYFILS